MHFSLEVNGYTDTVLDATLRADGEVVERFQTNNLKDAERIGKRLAANYKRDTLAATRVEYNKSFEL